MQCFLDIVIIRLCLVSSGGVTVVCWTCNLEVAGLTPARCTARQVVHTHVSLFTKQYNLVPVKGRWCSVAEKVTVCLASHWLCVTDSVVYPPTGSMAIDREMSTPLIMPQ